MMVARAESIDGNLRRVRQRIAAAATSAGRDPASVRLVAVSKTVTSDAVAVALRAGQTVFGENRVQELVAKRAALPATAEWHMIGRLQRNKVRATVGAARLIHSVDSPRLLERIHACARQAGMVQDILLQATILGEASKAGWPPAELDDAVRLAAALAGVNCLGFMTMAPLGAGEPELRRCFGGLRRAAEQQRQRHGLALPELSMGMSGDFEVAVAEGATLVRIGTAIFGANGG